MGHKMEYLSKNLSEISKAYESDAIKWRRDFHKYAEEGWGEFRTTSKIIEILKKDGIEVLYGLDVINPKYTWSYPKDNINSLVERAIDQGGNEELIKSMNGYTGAVAIIDSGNPGPTIALRFDIDALKVTESEGPDHLPYSLGFSSINKTNMHACGHDGHTAMGLTVSLILNKYKENLKGKIKVIFQPGEEGVLGAQSVAESGVLDDVDIFLSGHLGNGLPSNTLAVFNEGYLASTKFDVTILGKSAHAGASPQEGNNAILAASSAILSMYSLCQDGRGAARVNVGKIVGGTGRNVVPDKVTMQIETRGKTDEIEQRVFNNCISILENTSKMFGCTFESEIKGYAPYVICDKELSEYIEKGASKVSEISNIIPRLESSSSEDVGYLMKKVRERGGLAAFMGIGSDLKAPHHNEKFDFNENDIIIGAKTYIQILIEMLSNY